MFVRSSFDKLRGNPHAIAGAPLPAPALSSFWSDQYGMRINYLGHASLSDAVEIDGDTLVELRLGHLVPQS